MRIAAVIIAGGRSSRMGREKAFEQVGHHSILERTMLRLRSQAETLVINANGYAGRFGEAGLAVIPDRRDDLGTPLAGLHTALSLADMEGFDAVLTVPSDCPFLPDNLAARLVQAKALAAIAASGGQAHFVTGLWRPVLLQQLQKALDRPNLPRLQDWAREVEAAIVEWAVQPYDPFFNVNTVEELAEANRIAAEFRA
jgi:molybdenum cofactor guanylyltransferase